MSNFVLSDPGRSLWNTVNQMDLNFILSDSGRSSPSTVNQMDLPRVPPILQREKPSRLSSSRFPERKRKRARLDPDLLTSSDPALFSSDDGHPSLEAYKSRRQKTQWQGTWWSEKSQPVKQDLIEGKRKLTRNLDSGVWMGSDGTDVSFEDEQFRESLFAGDESLRSSFVREDAGTEDPMIVDAGPLEPARSDENAQGSQKSVRQDLVKAQPQTEILLSESIRGPDIGQCVESIVDRCLEAGDENVDLSGMNLKEIPAGSLNRLRGFVKHNVIENSWPGRQTYAPIEPSLRLYLNSNSLTTFPREILNLTKLETLIMHNNKLKTLPPAISTLGNLKRLHIGGNQLEYLPYEILQLFQRDMFFLFTSPSSFIEPDADAVYLEGVKPESAPPVNFLGPLGPLVNVISTSVNLFTTPKVIRRGKLTYFHPDGSRLDPRFNPSHPPSTISSSSSSTPTRRAPSLHELALQKCQHLPDLAEIKEWCETSHGPGNLSRVLGMAHDAKALGINKCSVCGKRFIVPRVQWFEFAERRAGSTAPEQNLLPLLRRGCSWACVV